jgi:hypothetical protein
MPWQLLRLNTFTPLEVQQQLKRKRLNKRSKDFENYQLGYKVVHDLSNNAHGTLWNEDADFLVKHDALRFEYLNAPDYWKGIDYRELGQLRKSLPGNS